MTIRAHGRIYENISQTTGATPLVRFSRLAREAGVTAEICGKLEFLTRFPRSRTVSAFR